MSNSEHASQAERSERKTFLDRLRSLFGMETPSIRDDIEDALEDSSVGEEFSAQERSILKNVLGLHELRVQDIMVPRSDIIAVSLDTSLAEVLSVFRTAGHSRLPVYGGSLDDLRGMVHIRDFVDYMASAAEGFFVQQAPSVDADDRFSLRQAIMRLRGLGELDLSLQLEKAGILRPVLFVPPSMPALDLLVRMQSTRTHMALIIDEYGGTDGLASIEDIVETIVGDIEDEHDLAEVSKIQKMEDGTWRIDARAGLDEVEEALDCELKSLVENDNVDTLGGLVTTLSGRVPPRGEVIRVSESLMLEVLDADRRRVKRIGVRRDFTDESTSKSAGHERLD